MSEVPSKNQITGLLLWILTPENFANLYVVEGFFVRDQDKQFWGFCFFNFWHKKIINSIMTQLKCSFCEETINNSFYYSINNWTRDSYTIIELLISCLAYTVLVRNTV